MNTISPDIYQYTDARTYLRDYRLARKECDEGFTNTYICYVLGQKNSKGYFNNVIQGRVRIGSTILDRFRDLLGLSNDEFSYFCNMVNYTQARTADERETAFQLLLKSNRMKAKELTVGMDAFYSEWYHSVVRAMTDLVDFDGTNFEIIQQRMAVPLTLPKLKQSVALLQELKLIQRNEAGFFKPADAIISNGSDIERAILKRFQEKTLKQSSEVVQDGNVAPQKITTMTVTVSKTAFDQIEERITALKHEIRAIAQNDTETADNLYQLAIHLYPYTRSVE